MTLGEAKAFRQKLSSIVNQLNDEDALDAMELFPLWKEDILVNAGEKYRYNGYLYKVNQTHNTQANWTPDITPALFTKIQINQEQGTIDNPIPYSLNMELIEGKYYLDNNVLYLCTRSLAASYWSLESLIGQYVEVVS